MEPGSFFFYGTLRHAPLLTTVLGREVETHPARLSGHAVHWAEGQAYPVIREETGAEAEGVTVEGLGPEEAARLHFYEAGFGYAAEVRPVETGSGAISAQVYLPKREIPCGEPWSLARWAESWGAVATEAAREIMALRGERPPEAIFARYHQILVRAASRLRARTGGPATLRRRAIPEDVRLETWRQPYARFFAVEEFDLRFRRFDGSMSEVVPREVFISGDAATVLPYDPSRDRVLVIEQFRPGPFARGDGQPWLIEPVAGRVDAGETPEDAVRREALEEAGIGLGELLPIAAYYPSPAGKAEFLYSFLGLADLPDGWAATASGVADEHEDIRTHILSFDRLMQLVETGEVENGPLLISALFLARHRDRLRGAA
ncbi:MAG: NUDIX domain-containing protein [Paracoccaceae bacterium]|nr:NUDIX domain-containing protein [Paracoccaceae bacterium]